jgi:Leucine carboxyl methyltransferase
VVRTRLIDDLLDAALADGVRQVVLLGAGYDSRAFRLAQVGGHEADVAAPIRGHGTYMDRRAWMAPVS